MRLWANARLATKAVGLMLWTLLVYSSAAYGVESSVPSSVDVYWKSTHSIAAPGVTAVLVLDEDVAHAQLGNEVIEFAGIARGSARPRI